MKIAVSLIALLAATGFAHAADLIVDTPAAVPVAVSSGLRGVIEVGVLGNHISQTDEDISEWGFGGYASAAIWGNSDGLVWGLDGYIDGNNFGTPDTAPTYVGVVGGHLGFDTGSGSLGGFVSVGATPDYDNEARWGYTAGVEGIAALSSGVSVFGQLGWADVRVDGDDAGFTGPFGRVGALFALSDEMAVVADLSAGSSDDFTGQGQKGTYWAAGVKAAFKLPADFDAFLTAGYEFAHYDGVDDGDTGDSHTIKVGLSIPFGDGNTAATTLNPLATSVLPYRAASWSETLD